MKKNCLFWSIVFALLLVTIGSAYADIAPTVTSYSISSTSGEVPASITISITCPINVRGMKVVDQTGVALMGSESVKQNIDGTRTFVLESNFTNSYTGKLSVYLKVGGETWIPSGVEFDVSYYSRMESSNFSEPVVPKQWFALNSGDILVFGNYEQDNDKENGKEPVEWIVLDVDYDENKALLLSKHVLDMQRYHKSYSKVSWAKCSVRSWLNKTFLSSCFSKNEQKAIVKTELISNYSDDSVETMDQVFFLSIDEASGFLPTDDERQAVPTDYAVACEAVEDDGYSYWWLRDTTNRKNDANRVDPDGDFEEYGANTNAYGVGIRPALWVDLSALSAQ